MLPLLSSQHHDGESLCYPVDSSFRLKFLRTVISGGIVRMFSLQQLLIPSDTQPVLPFLSFTNMAHNNEAPSKEIKWFSSSVCPGQAVDAAEV